MKKHKDSMKIKNMITGKVINVWPSTDHPDSSYGMPQWVDKDGNSYGQCDLWEVPFGYVKTQ
jgi:predicted transcriptional regulator